MDFWTVLAVSMGAFALAGLVKGMIGLGMPLTALAVLGSVLDLRLAIPIVVLPTLVLNIYQAFAGGGLQNAFRRFFWMFVAASIGTIGGVQILFAVNQSLLIGILGLILTAYVLFNLFAVDLQVPDGWEKWMNAPIGLVGGLIGGSLGTMIVPVVVYIQALRLPKDLFIQTLGFLFFSQTLFWAGALAEKGAFDRDTLIIAFVSMVPATITLLLGTMFRNKLAPETFRKAVFVMLLILGANMLRRSALQLGLF